MRSGYAVRSINSMLAAVNSFLEFMNRRECRVKTIKLQKEVYCREDRLLTKAEYMRLLDAAKAHPRLFLLLQTICRTGIRISELSHFTVEAVRQGRLWCIVRAKPEQFCFLKSFGRFCWHTQSRRHMHGGYLPHTYGASTRQEQHLVGDEAALRCRKSESVKGVSTQSAQAVRPRLLQHREGHCKTGRYPWAQQYRYNTYLHHDSGRRTPTQNRPPRFDPTMKTPHNAHYAVFTLQLL